MAKLIEEIRVKMDDRKNRSYWRGVYAGLTGYDGYNEFSLIGYRIGLRLRGLGFEN